MRILLSKVGYNAIYRAPEDDARSQKGISVMVDKGLPEAELSVKPVVEVYTRPKQLVNE